MSKNKYEYKFGLLGVGKMGSAILGGLIKKDIYKPEEIVIYTLEEDIKEKYKKQGINIANDEIDLFNSSSVTLMAIKPQIYDSVLEKVKGNYNNKTIISIAPGKKIEYLESFFKDAFIVRAMPNTPALINQAMITYAVNNESEEEKIEEAKKIFSSIGKSIVLEEWQIDEAIPLNGSMPAYIFKFAKDFIDCGIGHGLSEEKAKELALNSIIGSSLLALSSPDDLQTLINNVCSKGGTTIAGLEKLEENGFTTSIQACFDACVNRSKELGK
jgi:pyrroline-5-carboxylate reductase